MKSSCFVVAAAFSASAAFGAVPEVSSVTMSQDSSRLVTITYTLANAPAVVTLDVLTNGVSIGGANIGCLSGDVNKIVTANGSHTITWRPDLSWPDHKIAESICQAAVTAWAMDCPPDYAVIDLVEKTDCRWRFYPAEEFLPGGILGNTAYRTSKLVMRKIHAKNVSWTMGSIANNTAHAVTLADDYYIGVFELTQAQWKCIPFVSTRTPAFAIEGAMRPLETEVLYNIAMMGRSSTYFPPNNPHPDSFVGMLTARAENVSVFTIPTEAQWEFACRAGHGEGYYGNGMPETEASMQLVGRCPYNGGTGAKPETDGPERGTAIVGSYLPNDWGLYDMTGNIAEFCIDYWQDDITGNHDGVPPFVGKDASGNTNVKHVKRGGCFWNGIEQQNCWSRESADDNYGATAHGYRLTCSATLTASVE